MLNKLNKLYRKIILQDCIQQDFQKLISPDNWKKQICDDETFFKTYIQPLNKDIKLLIGLDMENTFRVDGLWEDVKQFLTKFKVDNQFIQDPSLFKVYAPMVIFSENAFGHKLQYNEGFTPKQAFNPNYTMTWDQNILQGRWMDLLDNNPEYEYNIRVKCCTPRELIKFIEYNMEINQIEPSETLAIALEFYVNCSGNANGRSEQNSTTFPLLKNGKTITDLINDPNKNNQPTVITKETRNKPIKPEFSKKNVKKTK